MEKSKADKQNLLDRLLDAVKQCQVRFGGRTELATDVDSRVSCLCAQFETVLMHGLKKSTGNPLSAIKQMTVSSIAGIKTESDAVFWPIVKEQLTRHELQRYISLKSITTDAGRGRAWLRSTLNEHSLERYLHMIQGNKQLLSQFYEPWAFILDEERASMLPTMARGLGSILFAINIDNQQLNGIKQVSVPSLSTMISTEHAQSVDSAMCDQEPVLSKEVSSRTGSHEKERKEKRKKKKKGPTSIVSFDDDSEEKSSTENHPASKRKPKSQKSSPSKSGLTHISNTSTVHNIDEYKDLNQHLTQTQEISRGERLKFTELSSSTEDGAIDSKPIEVITPTNSIPIDFRTSIAPSHLSTSFPGKTPPSTPYDLSTLSQYGLHEKMDVEYIMKRVQDGESRRISERSSQQNSDELEGSGETDSTTDKNDLVNGEVVQMRAANGGQDCDRRRSSALFQVLGDEGPGDLIPLSHDAATEDTQSNDSSMLGFGVETDSATMGVALAQKGLQLRLPKFLEDATLPSPEYESMSNDDLKQALMSIMMRKDEVEDQNKSLRVLLDSEMEHTAKLRAELDELKKDYDDQEEKSYTKIQNITRDNEMLKHQLKKYVGAVQMLQRKGPSSIDEMQGIRKDDQPPIPEPKPPLVDYGEQSAEYERKLIQVAEMHGELMEFNDHLTRLLKAKDHLIKRLKTELIDLRGPLPDESSISEDASSQDADTASLTGPGRPLINLWIPSAFINGRSKDTFHVYQVYIRIRDEEWNIYRRYTQFRDFHNKIRKSHQAVNKFEFPPKKAVGNKEAKFVETRRKSLQAYLRLVINYHVQNYTDLTQEPCKAKLLKFMPFFGDIPVIKPKKQERPRSSLLSGRTNAVTENAYDGF